MVNEEHLILEEIKSYVAERLPNYHSYMPDTFYYGILTDVLECSAFQEDGTWNNSDISLAFEREIASRFGVEI